MLPLNRLLIADIFRHLDGFYFFNGSDCIRILSHDAGPLPLSPGWNPRRVITGMKNVNILELIHSEGQTALWLLDYRYRFTTNRIECMSQEAQSELIERIPTFPCIEFSSMDVVPSAPDCVQQNPVDYSLSRLGNAYIDGISIFNPNTPQKIFLLQDFWQKNDYVKIENALTPAALRLLNKSLTLDALEALNDPRQFHRIHNDEACNTFVRDFHSAVHEYYETILTSQLLRCGAFAMKYIRNSDLHPHYDNIHTQISSTICYHSEPAGYSNPLFLDKAKFFNPYQQRVTINDKDGIPSRNVVQLDLAPGDLAIFRGRSHLHWRNAIEETIDYRAMLVHFSESQYDGRLIQPRVVEGIPYTLIDFADYREFRQKYAVYFEGVGRTYT
jgi:hypothetical protein